MFYNNMDQKIILGDKWISVQIQKEALFLLTWLFLVFA